jgi:squalene-hopene/tetraprenyl-beta-curcumene cyclase
MTTRLKSSDALRRRDVLALMVAGAVARPGRVFGQDTPTAQALMAQAIPFLRTRQSADGGWSTQRGPGVSSIVTTGLLRSKQVTTADPMMAKALAYLEGTVGPNGGFDEAGQANYVTSVMLMALKEANADGRYNQTIAAGQRFLKGLQWGETRGNKDRASDFYGGAGYRGDQSRPDLSNTAFMMEALRETGLPADDPNLQKALIFVSRCQNLKSEFNDQPWADKVNDGGFVYTAANGGESKAGKDANGGLRSYAGMTYAGLKSMIHAGVSKDDPRVQAALKYIRKHYTLDENPGLGQVGLYYYYQTVAKAMAVLGEPTFVDEQGTAHDWRAELVAALAKRQQADGSWVNPADRFMEGDPNLVTAYCLLALAAVRSKA